MTVKEAKTIACHFCTTTLPVYEGYPTWCHHCYHNLNPTLQTEKENIWDLTYKKLNKKFGESLFQQVLSHHPDQLKKGTSRFFIYLLATVIHMVSASLLIVGIYFLLFR
jgi:hypothetical protein